MTGAAGFGSTATSTKHHRVHPGPGQLQVKSDVSAATTESPGAPFCPESNHQGEDHLLAEVGGQSDAATSTNVRYTMVDDLLRWHQECDLRLARGSQPARGSNVAPGNPVPNPIPTEDALASDRARWGEHSMGMPVLSAAVAVRQASLKARTEQLAMLEYILESSSQLSGSRRVALQAASQPVDPSYSQLKHAESLLGPTNRQHMHRAVILP